jgi:hypothetical protein
MYCSLFKFTLDHKSSFRFRKLLVFDFLLDISDMFLNSMFAPQVETFLLLDVH